MSDSGQDERQSHHYDQIDEQSEEVDGVHTPSYSSPIRSGTSVTVAKTTGNKPIPPIAYHALKWQRLRKDYRDTYLDLFNVTHEGSAEIDNVTELKSSQMGVIVWTAEEKDNFFRTLTKVSRHDLPRLALSVGSKSEIEVKSYIDNLQQALIDRQMFAKSVQNVSICDVPAAIEIGEGCETILNKASDALSAFQEQYDMAVGENVAASRWLIDRNAASKLDAEVEQHQGEYLLNRNDPEDESSHLFHLTTCLDLSELLFMNRPPETAHEHWKFLAEPGQRPALTKEVIDDLRNLVVSLTQRILQVSLFMAQSRIRATTSQNYVPVKVLNRTDVISALDVLKMPHDAWDFWTNLSRKNGYTIITGSHSQGESWMHEVSYDEAEAILSARSSRGRRRSMSVTSSEVSDDIGSEASSLPETDMMEQTDLDDLDADDGTNIEDVAQPEASGSESSDSDTGPQSHTGSDTEYMNHKKRRLLLEQSQEEYAERLDQQARAREEQTLFDTLGVAAEHTECRPVQEDFGPRPKTLRKTPDELYPWSCDYRAEWESFGRLDVFEGTKRKREEIDS